MIYIALFRSMNVGNNRITMKELSALLESQGCRNIKTYIQSGNAVFESEAKDAAALSGPIRQEIRKRHGFDSQVLLLELDEVKRAVRNNPFAEAGMDPRFIHLGFLAAAPDKPDEKGLESLRSGSERFRLVGKVFYLSAPEGIGRSRLAANAEKLLGVAMTDRNLRTVGAILEMADRLGSQ